MITLQSQVLLRDVTGAEILDFLLEPDDDSYRAWWPGTHLAFHVVGSTQRPDHRGDVVRVEEWIGSRRVRMKADVMEIVPGERVSWRLRRGRVRLPVRLTVTIRRDVEGVRLRHTIRAGWSGWGRVADPLWRRYFSRSFADALDRHAQTEFRLLRDLLVARRRGARSADPPADRSPDRPDRA